MKRMLLLFLILSVILSLSACNRNLGNDTNTDAPPSTRENTNDLPLYPQNTNENVYCIYSDIPKIIFSTTGSENGLSGTIYSFSGKMIGAHEKLDESFFVVETKYGNVLMMNVYYVAKDYMPSLKEECYTPPKTGESARFTCIYDGFSETAEMPCFVYGNDAFLLSSYFDTAEETTEPKETTVPPKVETIVFEGSGDEVLTNVVLENGRYKVHIVYAGDGVFAVFGYDADDDMVLMESNYGACDKYEVLRQAKFPLIIEITAETSWKIEFEKID